MMEGRSDGGDWTEGEWGRGAVEIQEGGFVGAGERGVRVPGKGGGRDEGGFGGVDGGESSCDAVDGSSHGMGEVMDYL